MFTCKLTTEYCLSNLPMSQNCKKKKTNKTIWEKYLFVAGNMLFYGF